MRKQNKFIKKWLLLTLNVFVISTLTETVYFNYRLILNYNRWLIL